jgi:hypothetical protein
MLICINFGLILPRVQLENIMTYCSFLCGRCKSLTVQKELTELFSVNSKLYETLHRYISNFSLNLSLNLGQYRPP